MPCQHRGICTPISNILYECDCAKGYFGKSCEKVTFSRWMYEQFKFSQATKQKLALSGKLLWAVVNNIPMLHDTALRYVYLNKVICVSLKGGSHFGGLDRGTPNFAEDYTTLDNYYNKTNLIRGLPPVPSECPTPLGIKGPKNLPQVDEVFELLFRRREFKPCPYGTNLILATFAQHWSHQFFSSDLCSERNVDTVGDCVSHIYGSDDITKKALRSMVKGKLKSKIINGEEYPPYLEDVPQVKMFYPESGKSRKPVHPKWAMGHQLLSMTPLTFVMSTIWLREHNRLCDIIIKEHPTWDDERIYQTVRWIVLGELLTITGGEYFQHLAQYRLKFGYKPHIFHDNPVLPSTRMQYEFSLIFQWHQTMPDTISINGKYYNLTNLMYGNNRIVFQHGLDAVVDAMGRNPAGKITYRNCGNAVRGGMKNLIEEGRKMRLHSLNDYRRFFDLKPYESFMELVDDKEMAEALKELYGDVDAVEFVVGIFMEKHSGSVIPPTMLCLAGPIALNKIMENPLGSAALWRASTFGGKTGFDVVQKATLQKCSPIFFHQNAQVQRLDGKTVIVTGCNTGIGKYNAFDFCKRGAKVIMACRDHEKAESAKTDIMKELQGTENVGSLIVKKLDLCSLKSVQKCAEEILAQEERIDILVNNAGIMMCGLSFTEDGIEKQFGTNHLGHFLFTLLLLPKLEKSAPSRIVNLSSSAHKWGDRNFDDHNYEKVAYNARRAYGRSKLANILFTKELAKRLQGKGVTTYAVHPGVVRTEIGRHLDETYFRGISSIIGATSKWMFRTPEQGAQTTIYCSVDKSTAGETGLYYSNCQVTKPSNDAHDMNLAEKLWDVSVELLKIRDFNPFAIHPGQ